MPILNSLSQNSLFRDSKWSSFVFPSCAVAVGGLSTYIFYQTVRNYFQKRHLHRLISSKRNERDVSIDEIKRILQTHDKSIEIRRREIVSLHFDELRSQLQTGRLTAVEALQAFQWRALQAQEQTNCVVEFLPEATVWAKELDEKCKDPNFSKPALFGIPISVKETHRMLGHDAAVGMAQFIGQPSEIDCNLVILMKRLGAVPFVLTTVPQSMLSIGSSNPIFGVTRNPHDPSRSAGGSSSGEGALIALRGSPLGLGTDIGGSVRVPAHWNGICGLKPSYSRITQVGRKGTVLGQTGVKGVSGPLGHDVDSLVWFMRAVCDAPMFGLDPYAVPYPFNENSYSADGRPMTIGYYDFDNWLEPTASCRRAVAVARQLLESKRHTLVKVAFPFDKNEIHQFMATYITTLVPDGGQGLASLCDHDITDPYHVGMMRMFGLPNWYRRLKSYLTRSQRSATRLRAFASNLVDQRDALSKIDSYKTKFVQFWQRHNLDALICPALATVALPPSLPPSLFALLWSYNALYNLLDFPAGIVRCTFVTSEDEENTRKMKREDERDWLSDLLCKYSQGTAGLPVGVQCVALPYREEICLRLMKEIETAVKEEEMKR